MDVMISARFTPSEAAELRAAAEQGKMSVSAFLRRRVIAALRSNVIDIERARAVVEVVHLPPSGRTTTRRYLRTTTTLSFEFRSSSGRCAVAARWALLTSLHVSPTTRARSLCDRDR